MLNIDNGNGFGTCGQKRPCDVGNAVFGPAGRSRGPDFITSSRKIRRGSRRPADRLVLRRYFGFGGDVLRRVRILQHVGFEVVVGKGVDDDVAFGAGRVQTRASPVVAPSRAYRPGRARRAARLDRPFRPRETVPCWINEDERPMRFALPQDVFVGLVKSDAPVRGQREKVRVCDSVEGRMIPEKV